MLGKVAPSNSDLCKPKQQQGQIQSHGTGAGAMPEAHQISKHSLELIPLLSRQGVSRHLHSQPVSSLGGKTIHMSQDITSNTNGTRASAILLSSSERRD